MRAIVIKLYRDKNSKRYRKPGEIIKMSDERFEEVNSTSLGIFLERLEGLEDEPEEQSTNESNDVESKEVLEGQDLTVQEQPTEELDQEQSAEKLETKESNSEESNGQDLPAVESQKKASRSKTSK